MFGLAFGVGWLGAAVKVVAVVALAAGAGVQSWRLKGALAEVAVLSAKNETARQAHAQCIAANRGFVETIDFQNGQIDDLALAVLSVQASVAAVDETLAAVSAASVKWRDEALRIKEQVRVAAEAAKQTNILASRAANAWAAKQRRDFAGLSADAAACRNAQVLFNEYFQGAQMKQGP